MYVVVADQPSGLGVIIRFPALGRHPETESGERHHHEINDAQGHKYAGDTGIAGADNINALRPRHGCFEHICRRSDDHFDPFTCDFGETAPARGDQFNIGDLAQVFGGLVEKTK